jgi:hypothetical protein
LASSQTHFYSRVEDRKCITGAQRTQQQNWVWHQPPPTNRCKLYLELWSFLKPLSSQELNRCFNEIKSWAAQEGKARTENSPMSETQLADLSRHSLFEVGLHTASHAALGCHTIEVQAMEIIENQKYLQAHCVSVLPSITFPYGNYNSETLAVLRQQKIKAAFTTEESVLTNRTPNHRIGRFQVKNWPADVFEERLRLWMAGSNI